MCVGGGDSLVGHRVGDRQGGGGHYNGQVGDDGVGGGARRVTAGEHACVGGGVVVPTLTLVSMEPETREPSKGANSRHSTLDLCPESVFVTAGAAGDGRGVG